VALLIGMPIKITQMGQYMIGKSKSLDHYKLQPTIKTKKNIRKIICIKN
jgi:hypothetical protein